MVGLGETYFAAFALAFGAGEITAGLLGPIPVLAADSLQLVTRSSVLCMCSYRRWVLSAVTVQGLSLLPLIVLRLVCHAPVWLLFVLFTIYHCGGTSAGPAWNSWMGLII